MRYTEAMKKVSKPRGRKVKDPHVYSLVLSVNKTGVFLYTGVHNNLDEATAAAREEAIQTVPLKKGETFDTELDLWTTYDGKKAVQELTQSEPFPMPRAERSPVFYSIEDCRVRIENARNFIMRKLIEGKDEAGLDKNRALLTPHQIKYVKGKIGQKP